MEEPTTNKKKIAIACLLLVAVGVVFWYNNRSDISKAIPETNSIWYYDLAEKKLVRTADRLAPFKTEAGVELVRAKVFACGECSDASKRYIGWLERFSDEAKSALKTKNNKTAYTGLTAGLETLDDAEIQAVIPPGSRQLRSIQSDAWLDYYSPEGEDIRLQSMDKCGEETPRNECDLIDF